MARQQWPLSNGRPVIEIVLTFALSGNSVMRTLLADTGAGSARSGFELILNEQDCVLCDGIPCPTISLGGAYSGVFPVYLIQVRVPQLSFDQSVRAVAVPQTPAALDGIAGYRFLNRFSFGNSGDPAHFGLEL